MAARRKRVLGVLISLTYETNPLIAWRAVEALGMAADRVAEKDKASVQSHLRRLHWLVSEESGGVCWYAPQAIAEIVRHRPRAFSNYADIVVTLLTTMAEEDLGHFRPGILWAIGRLAPVVIEKVYTALPGVAACLDDPDPQVRGMAVWCLTQAGEREVYRGRKDLLSDAGSVELYDDGRLNLTTVGALARG